MEIYVFKVFYPILFEDWWFSLILALFKASQGHFFDSFPSLAGNIVISHELVGK